MLYYNMKNIVRKERLARYIIDRVKNTMGTYENYKVTSDFQGGHAIQVKTEDGWIQCARYDSEGGESFSKSVTSEQKESIRDFARRAFIL